MAANALLHPVKAQGWRRGFANTLRKENNDWWRTRRWWIQFLIWFVLLNSVVAIPLWMQPAEPPAQMELTAEERAAWVESSRVENRVQNALRTFVDMSGLTVAFGVMIILQSAIIDEKRSGTGAWVLSKPVSRSSFILAKLVAHATALTVIVLAVQWVLVYLQVWAASGTALPVMPYLFSLAITALHMLFYVALALMLGVVFNNRGAILGIPLAVIFTVMFLSNSLPGLLEITPLPLTIGTLGSPENGIIDSLALQALHGQTLSTVTPIVFTALWIVVFVGVAIWRFRREEF